MLYYYPPHNIKLGKPYDGPFLVVRRVSEVHYQIQREDAGRRRRVHVDSLKLCHFLVGEEPASWITDAGCEREATPDSVVGDGMAPLGMFGEEMAARAVAPLEAEVDEPPRRDPDVWRSGRTTKRPLRLNL